ncbi:SpoIIE family protein phosphatase [Kitasatospora purpeofusca]|uniref:SpoIIE family protein phosphatase n=1 Tax=Kitasatospora purpeofusca TaxID=67352 RepID=UPI002254D0F2|nr:SpoIIE family protein phosphatase [Kitasatospora purpeofusca]MCX4683023.1 SpoIIE family protein phosphatase [Kitasatospora purpeofusca]
MHQPHDQPADRSAGALPRTGSPKVGPQRDHQDTHPDTHPDDHQASHPDGRPTDTRPAPTAVTRLAATVENLRTELARARADAAGRSLVEMAAGVLVERLRCGPAEAAGQLTALAEQADVPVLEFAAELVNQVAADRISAIAREFVTSSVGRSEEAANRSEEASVRLRAAEAHSLAAGDSESVARSMLATALRPLGAVAVAIWAAHPDQSLTLEGSAGFGEAEARRWRYVPPGVSTPARRALDERETVVFPSLVHAALPTIGQHEYTGGRIAVPAGTGGRLIGVLEICWPTDLPPRSQSLQRQFEALAELCATTLETWTEPTGPKRTDREFDELQRLTDGVLDPCLILRLSPGNTELPLEFAVRHVNPAFVDFAGRPNSAVAGARLLEAYPLAAEAGGLAEKVEHVFATGEPFRTMDMRLAATVDGIPLLARAQVSISRHGRHVVVIWRLDDGTPRVARLLQHAQRLGRIGGFEENVQTGQIAWNETLFDLHGLPPTARPIALDRLPEHAHPDDRPAIGRFLRTLLHHRRPAATAFRLHRPDGVARHIRVVAEPVHDENAALTIVRGAYQDVSAQHWTEVALAATRDQLAHSEQQAAERSRLALQLQHAIMPPARGPLTLHDLQVAVRYRPAEKDHLVGGDWYDTLALPSGEILLCVGDVAGHGIEAATGMVALRNALRGLAATGAGPAQLLTWLNSVTHHLTDNVTATAVCALYHPGTRRLRWARAGHLPPVLLRQGRARALPQPGGILLGALDHADYEESHLELRAGDTLVMFTDGLIERRDESVQASLDSLLSLSEKTSLAKDGAPDSLESHLDHLLRYSSADTDDDTCLVGISVDRASSDTPEG